MFKETIQRIYFLLKKKKPVDLNIWSVSLFLSWLFFSLFFFCFVSGGGGLFGFFLSSLLVTHAFF